MTEFDQAAAYRVYSAIPGARSGEDWLSIGLAVPHKDGRGYDVMLHALPLNSRLILRDIFNDGTASSRPEPDKHEPEPSSLKQQLDSYERAIIEQCLVDSAGRISAVMQRLNIPRRTLNEKMARLGIDRNRFTLGSETHDRQRAEEMTGQAQSERVITVPSTVPASEMAKANNG